MSVNAVHRARQLTIGLFMLLMVAPFLQNHVGLIQYRQLDENRNRAEEPDAGVADGTIVERLYRGGVQFSQAYEKFFNDHYGFRDLLIMLKNQLDYSVFRSSDEVLIGRDGYLFLKVAVEDQLVSAQRISDDQLHVIQNNILKFDRYLKSRGIQLISVLCRERETIYGNQVIHATVQFPKRTRAEDHVEFFRAHPELPFIDSRKLLENAKTDEPVFYRTDFHWNAVGAYQVGKVLTNMLAKLEHSKVRWKHPLRIERKPGFGGTLNKHLALLSLKTEDEIDITPRDDHRTDPVLPPPFPFESFYRASDPKGLLPPTVILGNSFSPYFFKAGMQDYFQSIGYLFKGNLQVRNPDDFIPPGTKYLVWQFNEFDIGTFYANPAVWNTIPDVGGE